MPSYKNYLVFFILLVFAGCSNETQQINLPSQKVFEKEDEFIIRALNHETKEEFQQAGDIYGQLYERSKKLEYRLSQIKAVAKAKNYESAKKLIQETTNIDNNKDKLTVLKILLNIHILEKNYPDANQVALKMLDIEKSKEYYKTVANTYLIVGDFDKALVYLEKGYSIDNDEEILDDIVTILYLYKNDKAGAISHLESHLRLNDVNKQLAIKLIKIYSNEKDLDGIISVYKLLYEKFEEEAYAKNLIDLYRFKGDIKNLIAFLEKSQFDNKMLLSIYQNSQDYKKALALASKLYKETSDYSFLAQEAVLEYEIMKVKELSKVKEIIKKLDIAVNNMKVKNAIMYNYLGYLYIDHDIDVPTGIIWIKKALELQKDSPYYMDSLAWGYYKINETQKAYELMKQVIEMLGLEDKELRNHWEQISKKYEEEILSKGTK